MSLFVGTKFPSSLAGIAEVPDISFREKAHSVTEDDQTVSVCVVAGKLAEDILPLKVAISTTNDTAKSKLIIGYIFIAEGRRCSDLWRMACTSLVPRPHPAFHHLQYGKAGEGLHVYVCQVETHHCFIHEDSTIVLFPCPDL